MKGEWESMEMFCFGVLAGVITALIGVWIAYGNNTEQPDGDSDIRIYHPSHDRSDRCMDRHITEEEMIIVIEYYMIGATMYEKKVLTAVIDKLRREQDA